MPFITKYRKRSRYRTFPITVVFISEQEIKLNINSVLSSTLTEHVKNQYVCLKLSLIFHHNFRSFPKIPVKNPCLFWLKVNAYMCLFGQYKFIKQTGVLHCNLYLSPGYSADIGDICFIFP